MLKVKNEANGRRKELRVQDMSALKQQFEEDPLHTVLALLGATNEPLMEGIDPQRLNDQRTKYEEALKKIVQETEAENAEKLQAIEKALCKFFPKFREAHRVLAQRGKKRPREEQSQTEVTR